MGPRVQFILLISVLLVRLGGAHAAVDHSIYGDLLRRYVKDGVVDYAGFKRNEARLDQYLKVLENTKTESLDRNDQFAFYVNAYNAWTIKLILSGYPGIDSIKDLGNLLKSPWKKKIARIDGDIVTLDHIEHNVLRPRYKDPRVHFAINCASKSCPPLISEPYNGAVLEQQLDAVVRAFLNDRKQNRLEGNTLYASKIFKWFEDDFNKDIMGFFLKYTEGAFRKDLAANRDKIRIKFLDYDWSLNGV
ncbi:MAG TPA: DUF547 domain-containing protein [Deltaproteobacteria bacterium]|nr:DUF547 domain-containing protein [Deltaproteobacteria bacterium]